MTELKDRIQNYWKSPTLGLCSRYTGHLKKLSQSARGKRRTFRLLKMYVAVCLIIITKFKVQFICMCNVLLVAIKRKHLHDQFIRGEIFRHISATGAYFVLIIYILVVDCWLSDGNFKTTHCEADCETSTRGSHICIACRSVCDQDQNGIKRSRSFSEAIKGSRCFSGTIKRSRWSQSYNINDQILFLANYYSDSQTSGWSRGIVSFPGHFSPHSGANNGLGMRLVWAQDFSRPRLASFPGHFPLRSLDRIRDLWTAWRSGRRPGISSHHQTARWTRSWCGLGFRE